MAELAAGAVSSLLGIIRNEALLLDRVHGDVQFIKEEMESINSFLAHLTRTAPPDGEHDEQVRTWMKQVRELAHDCSTCIDLYLQRGNPAIHRAQGGLMWRYVWWAPWFAKKLLAQHRAALQLSKLKDRARDVGERRLRYGVEVPTKKAAASSPGHGSETAALTPPSHAAHAAAAGGAAARGVEEDVDDHIDHASMAIVGDPDLRRALEPRTIEDYCREKLHEWLKVVKTKKSSVQSIAIDASASEDATAIAHTVVSYVAADDGFNPVVWINLPALHSEFDLPLVPWEILCYILRELKLKSQPAAEQGTDQGKQGEEDDKTKEDKKETEEEEEEEEDSYDLDELQAKACDEKWDVYDEIWGNIKKNNINKRIKEIKEKIKNVKRTVHEIQSMLRNHDSTNKIYLPVISTKPLGILFLALLSTKPDDEKDKTWARNALHTLRSDEANIIKKTADMLQHYMKIKAGKGSKIPRPSKEQYVNILSRVFLTQEQDKSATKSTGAATATTLGEDQIKEIVQKAIQDKQLEKHLEVADAIEETKNKIEDISKKIEDQLVIEGIVDKIKEHLRKGKDKKTLIILQDDKGFLSSWEETRNALSLLASTRAGAIMVVIITKRRQVAKEFCHPCWEPITYSLVGLYHDIVLQLTSQQAKENNNSHSQIFRDILDKCDPDEFCMKMFAHALYVKPSRSNNELCRLHNALISQQSVGSNTTKATPERSNDTTQLVSQQLLRNNAKKMFKFSYNDLPREFKSCLLYLAIFPQGHNIRRSNLEGRWVVEGLITEEDWPSAVRYAGRCFDELIDRWLVYPGDFGATGKVQSCVVGEIVHEFITKTAKKQHIVETRLSHHLAHHFSVFSNLRLRRSDEIHNFMDNLQKFSHYLRLLKVLDLEGCEIFDKKNHYLKDICNRIVLLKYLSLRKTNVTNLPTAINNLQELEVLDIRQTNVPELDTKYVLILKLKRLLAGGVYSSPSSSSTGTDPGQKETLPTSVRIPRKIEKMEHMEVMSNVSVSQHGNELKDIGNLLQLKKLGVVIDDNTVHLRNLLQAINDLNESLQSLTITLTKTRRAGTVEPSSLDNISSCLVQHSKLLENLSINGVTQRVQLLPILANVSSNLAMVTLSRTCMKQDNLKGITKLPNLCCLRLREEAYTEEEITFKENEFLNLKYLIIEGSNMANIRFEQGAAPKLEKIVVSFTSIEYLHGITHLQNLKELELNGNEWLQLACLVSASCISKVTLKNTLLDLSEDKRLVELPSLRTLMLLEKSCTGNSLNFNKGEFNKLNLLVVECSDLTSISFTDGAAPKLSKIVWSFKTKIESLSGISYLSQLKEIELNGDLVPDQVIQNIQEHKNMPVLRHNKKPQEDQPKKGRAH